MLAVSEVPESCEGKGALVMKIKHNLITELKRLLFNNTSDIGGGEEVRRLFNTFHDAVFKVSWQTTEVNPQARLLKWGSLDFWSAKRFSLEPESQSLSLLGALTKSTFRPN